jgi:hypothetical protein
MHDRWTDSRVVRLSAVLSAICLAYFLALDRLLFSSAHFSPIFRLLLTGDDSRTAWLSLGVCLLAAVWNRPAPFLRLADFFGNHPYSVALASTAVLTLGAVFVYHDYPLSMDEYAAVFQAKIFATGRLAAQLPRGLVDWLVVSGFNGSFLVASPESGRAIEHYWPGFAALLTPFQFLGVPWLCNATLAGLAIVLIYRITLEMTGDRRSAGWALLFAVASGGYIANAISYYSMQAHLTANLLFAALLLKPTGYRALGAGLVGSLALILHNPVPHALFAIPWIVALAPERDQRRFLLPLILGYLPGLAIGLGWLMLRGEIGAGLHGMATLHGVADGVFAWPDAPLLNMRAAALAKMWIWSLPGLFVFAFLGRCRHGDNRQVRLLTQSVVLTFAGYLFVQFDQGHGWGYRYFQSAWGAVPILAACAMTDRSAAGPRLVSFAGASAVLNLLIVMPFQMHQINEFIGQHLAQLPPPQRPGNNVYFIRPRGGLYVADMVQVDPLLRDRDLKLVSHGTQWDEKFIHRNWPDAVRAASGQAADQWYLGPQDQRVPITGRAAEKHFVISAPDPPSAADR